MRPAPIPPTSGRLIFSPGALIFSLGALIISSGRLIIRLPVLLSLSVLLSLLFLLSVPSPLLASVPVSTSVPLSAAVAAQSAPASASATASVSASSMATAAASIPAPESAAAQIQELEVNFSPPAFEGDFYLSGSPGFPPGVVATEANIAVFSRESMREVPARVVARDHWPDGSVLAADITFAANAARPQRYLIRFGAGITGKARLGQTAVLPVVGFATGGAPRAEEKLDMPVGQINVRVDNSPAFDYYWHLAPIIGLIALVIYRTRRAARP